MHWHWWQLALAVPALGIIDRVLAWAEDHDWIYYRRHQPSRTTLATALFQLQSIVQPEKQHIVDELRKIQDDREEEDDLPPPPLDLPKA